MATGENMTWTVGTRAYPDHEPRSPAVAHVMVVAARVARERHPQRESIMMRHFHIPVSLAAAVALLCTSSTAMAQSAQRWALQGSAIAVVPSGSAYEGLKSGGGVELQLRYNPSALSWGLGIQYSSHGIDAPGFGDEKVSLTGLFVEPRYVIDVGSSSYAPYMAARLSYLQQRLDVGGATASASGGQANLGGGVLMRLSPRLNLDLGLTYGIINFSDAEVSMNGQTVTVDGTSGNGQNRVLRVGLAVGLGG